MADEEKDVKQAEDASAEEEEILEEEDLDADDKDEESESEEEEKSAEESDDSEKESKQEEEPDAASIKAQLDKQLEINANLNKALQDKRAKERTPVVQQNAEKPNIDANVFVETMVKREEKAAFDELYTEFPQYSPSNDTDNSLYNELLKDMQYGVAIKGVPVKKEDFLDLARSAIILRHGAESVSKAKAEGRTEAHKEHIKADAANIGGTSSKSKQEQSVKATDADRRAANAAGMPIEKFLKYKNAYDSDGTV